MCCRMKYLMAICGIRKTLDAGTDVVQWIFSNMIDWPLSRPEVYRRKETNAEFN